MFAGISEKRETVKAETGLDLRRKAADINGRAPATDCSGRIWAEAQLGRRI
jgi:hypothetical protein